MLSPKKTKYRKQFKGRIHGMAKGGFTLNFGSYGLKAVEPERITARQIEAARRAITRQMKRQGRVWIRIFPDVPVTEQAGRSPHGQGQGRGRNTGPRGSTRAGSCSRSTACRTMSPVKPAPRRGQAAGAAPAIRRPAIDAAVAERRVMKIDDVRGLRPPTSWPTSSLSLKKEQFNLRFQKATGQIEKTHRVARCPQGHRPHQDVLRDEAAAAGLTED